MLLNLLKITMWFSRERNAFEIFAMPFLKAKTGCVSSTVLERKRRVFLFFKDFGQSRDIFFLVQIAMLNVIRYEMVLFFKNN